MSQESKVEKNTFDLKPSSETSLILGFFLDLFLDPFSQPRFKSFTLPCACVDLHFLECRNCVKTRADLPG